MAFRVTTFFGLFALLLPFVTAHWSRRHQEVAHRARGDVDIHKRQTFTNAKFTFYDVGLGACGQYNVASDWIVALNVLQYGGGYPGPLCFQSITIQYGGKTAQATIMDECMGCPYGGLDFSRGLFDYFASESEGVLYGLWWFNGGDQPSSSDSPSPTWEPPTTSSTPDYTPPPPTSTPDYTPPPTSSAPAYTPPPTTSTQSTTSAVLSSSTSSHSSFSLASSLSVVAIPTGTMVPTPNSSSPQNLVAVNAIMVDIGALLFAADKV